MATCVLRVAGDATPAEIKAAKAAVSRPLRPPQPVATVAHHGPGEALLTCTCTGLRTLVDVDDPQIRDYLLAQHLRTAHPDADHLLLDDERTGIWSSLTPDAEPESVLTLAAGAR